MQLCDMLFIGTSPFHVNTVRVLAWFGDGPPTRFDLCQN